jgi:hypothetical protein
LRIALVDTAARQHGEGGGIGMNWADATDPSVFAAVTGQTLTGTTPDEVVADVRRVLGIASEILTLATGHLIHPAGSQVEEFVGRGIRRLSPVYGPVTGINSLAVVNEDETIRPITGYRRLGNMILLPSNQRGVNGSLPLWRVNAIGAACAEPETFYRLDYRFGSTLTHSGRQAAVDYAQQLWLALEDSQECALPQRVTSLTREGVGIEMLTPQDYLDRGRTGLPNVDEWLAQANPRRVLRPAGVYTPDSPPGVGTRLRRA